MNTAAKLNVEYGKAFNITGYVLTYDGTFLTITADENEAMWIYQQYLREGGVRLGNGPATRFVSFDSLEWCAFVKAEKA
jgi:hypothetical protein